VFSAGSAATSAATSAASASTDDRACLSRGAAR